MIKAEVLADSIFKGSRLISLKISAPKFLDAEIEKHRMISSNSSSDRAIPVLQMLENPPFIPLDVRLNEKGMQGYESPSKERLESFYYDLNKLHEAVVSFCKKHQHIHKQHLNRYLLPFSLQTKILTANVEQFEYFIKLRADKYADPNIQILALNIKEAISNSQPKPLDANDWHLPFIFEDEYHYDIDMLLRASVARCARVSYNYHDGKRSTIEQDLELANRLQEHGHWSCFEHQALPLLNEESCTHVDRQGRLWSGNFMNWVQYRQQISRWN